MQATFQWHLISSFYEYDGKSTAVSQHGLAL
jgi:hypothetical protein